MLVETWLVPFEAALVDRYGPRRMVIDRRRLCRARLGRQFLCDVAPELLYAGSILAGIGAGIVYGTCVGNALKWFSGKRGLAAGLTAAGFGAGAALTVIPLAKMVASRVAGKKHFWFSASFKAPSS